MVSTRGIKPKFSVGEKVLCYEPDPLKAKVLYNSKVLKILEEKEGSKRDVEFLIHFSGWNSTWDRYVTEDFILKDTDENRRLQQELAERAQLTSGGNLYKRERRTKKRHRKPSSSHSSFSQVENNYEHTNGSSSGDVLNCTPATGTNNNSNSSTDEMSSSCSDERETNNENINTEFPPTQRCVTPTLPLSDTLRNVLVNDQNQVKHCNMVVSLPAAPTVIEILEGFYRHEATQEINAFPNKTPSQHENIPPTLEDLTRSLNCLEQVIDGVRIYFDFSLRDILLYNAELKQYEFHQKNYQRPSSCFRTVICDNINIKREPESDEENYTQVDDKQSTPCFDSDTDKRSARSDFAPSSHPHNRRDHLEEKLLNGHILSDDMNYAESICHHQRLDSVSSVDSISSSVGGPTSSYSSTSTPYLLNLDVSRTRMIERLKRWSFVPERVLNSTSQPLPSAIYGAVHLTRFLLKLPGLLTESALPDEKLEYLIEKINDLTEYIENHEEWFRPNIYVANTF